MNRSITIAAAALATVAFCASASAQISPGGGAAPNAGGVPSGNHMGQNNMTQDEFNQVQEYADEAKRLTKEDKAKGKTLADLLAEDKVTAEALAKSMPLSCEVDQAMLAAQGPVTVDGKQVDTKTYEVTCSNGMGYFLISQTPGAPYGFSCFAADFTRAADVAAGREPGIVCKLPPNADLKAMAAGLLSKVGVTCAVRDTKWAGQNSAAKTEFNEIACTDGKGYIVTSALPGSTKPVHALSCHDSAAQGLPCKLSDNGPPLMTLQTFKDALGQHNVACDASASESAIHFHGQETAKKRYVVEFKCTQYPKGLVAYIPLNGNTAPFETTDCATAAKRKPEILCKLTGTK